MQQNPTTQLAGAGRTAHRQTRDYRSPPLFGANGDSPTGPSQIPAAFPNNGQGRPNGMMAAPPPLDLARSPPGAVNKNTKHVPCKFFRQGACQAGQACPFLHSTDTTIETAPCKYFAKGTCKFGAKCALAHVFPDGRRVSRPKGTAGMNMNTGTLNIGGRVNPPTYQHQDSALAHSLLSQQQIQSDPFSGQYQYPHDEANFPQEYDGRSAHFPGEPGLSSNPGSKYGSPTNDSQFARPGLEHRLTALDAPLPASFDSNGISHIARYGAVAASVPSKFGMESPPASLPQRTGGPAVDAVKTLRSSAFPSNLRNSSQAANPEETAGSQRKMHSQQNAQRPPPPLLSASVPRPGTNGDWEDGFPLEEDFLPTNLHEDVLTPQEKMRRLSRPEQDFGGGSKTVTTPGSGGGGLGIPSTSSSKVGSPLGSSPSRFSALFAKQRQESNQANATFSHVGSPLRESHIQPPSDSPFGDGVTARPSPGSRSRTGVAGDQSPFFSSPPQKSTSNFGMSMISSQLQRTHLVSRNDSSDTHPPASSSLLQPPTAGSGSVTGLGMRHVSPPMVVGGAGGMTSSSGSGQRVVDRTISSPRITSTTIAEEREGEGDLVFSMDDDTSKRNSSLWGHRGLSPVIAPLQAEASAITTTSRNGISTQRQPNVAAAGTGGATGSQKQFPSSTSLDHENEFSNNNPGANRS